MLVLARKRSERILIGDDIVVTICKIGNEIVKVGIEAPPNVRVIREECDFPPPQAKAA